jgi:serine-type D-Ala-D-Ala carboxypeptidase/endopeptidase (penicillin-binding protein 4)
LKKTFSARIRLIMTFLVLMIPLINNGISSSANTLTKEDVLNQKFSELFNHDPVMQGALAGVSIRSAITGNIIYDHLGDLRLRPASNLKLMTAAAALSVLGENYTFSTSLFTDGQVVGNIIFGNLFLKGKGDPTLLKKDFDNFAEQLIQMGVTVIQGDLIGDDTWYDDVRLSVDLPWSDEHTYYGAQISALTASPNKDFDAGSVIVEVQPSKKVGQHALISITPNNDYMKIVNNTKTVKSDGRNNIDIVREHGTNTINIVGTIPVKSAKITDWIAVSNPTCYALDLFKQSLEEQGIVINGKVRRGTVPNKASLLSTHQSMPLSSLLVPFMKLSNNVHAETLIKEMGRVKTGEGSWDKGLEVLQSELLNFGVNTETLLIRDGSGISHLNLVPANEISKLLFTVQKKPWYNTFLHSLPVGGEKEKLVGGTLRHRMDHPMFKGKIKAKTGTLTSVSSLSGYVETRSGEELIFSILLNNLIDEEKGKELEDRLVEILVTL